jgi:tyrosyl-tRNA synthetase
VNDVIDDLHRRGLIAQSTDEAALRAHLAEGPVTYYCGFDPTAQSLHVGSLLQFMVLRRCSGPATSPVVLVGGATGPDRRPPPDRRAAAQRPGDRRGLGAAHPEQVAPFLDLPAEPTG